MLFFIQVFADETSKKGTGQTEIITLTFFIINVINQKGLKFKIY